MIIRVQNRMVIPSCNYGNIEILSDIAFDTMTDNSEATNLAKKLNITIENKSNISAKEYESIARSMVQQSIEEQRKIYDEYNSEFFTLK